jgi:hypothetical protein
MAMITTHYMFHHFIVMLDEGILQHLQKFISSISYLNSLHLLLYLTPPPRIPAIVSTGIIFAFVYICIHCLHCIHPPPPFPPSPPPSHHVITCLISLNDKFIKNKIYFLSPFGNIHTYIYMHVYIFPYIVFIYIMEYIMII